MRVAHRLLAATLALTTFLGVAGAGVVPASAQDPRGAFKVADTPLPPVGPDAAVVSLTFDDGPHPTFTPQVLEILRRYNVKATFFMLGSQAEKHPDLVRQVLAEGHAVANHTFLHPGLPNLDDERFSAEVDRTQDILGGITGQRPTCLRPPYGRSDDATVARLAARNLTPVFWTQDSRDFEKVGADAIVTNSTSRLGNGSIILFHDAGGDRAQTIAALPRAIEQIRAKGFGFVAICQPDVHIPIGAVDTVEGMKGRLRVTGWLADPDVGEPITGTVLIDGVEVQTITSAISRPELAEKGIPTDRGFDVTVKATAGVREVCIRGLNVAAGSSNPSIGCMTAEVVSPVPFSIVEEVNRVRYIQSVQALRLANPVLRVRQAWAAYWTMLLVRDLTG